MVPRSVQVPVPCEPQQNQPYNVQLSHEDQSIPVPVDEEESSGLDFLIYQNGHSLVEAGQLLETGRVKIPRYLTLRLMDKIKDAQSFGIGR